MCIIIEAGGSALATVQAISTHATLAMTGNRNVGAGRFFRIALLYQTDSRRPRQFDTCDARPLGAKK
jgi:hypothetical protein